jgi:hypothetical protein
LPVATRGTAWTASGGTFGACRRSSTHSRSNRYSSHPRLAAAAHRPVEVYLPPTGYSLDQLLASFLASADFAANTADAYRRDLRLFLGWCAQHALAHSSADTTQLYDHTDDSLASDPAHLVAAYNEPAELTRVPSP